MGNQKTKFFSIFGLWTWFYYKINKVANKRFMLFEKLFYSVLTMTDLNKDSEKDNSNSSSDKLLLARNLALVKNESESKSDGATNATIAHDEHVGEGELEKTPSIGDVGEDEDANDAVERAAEERDEHEARVPRVVVRHGAQAHEHEDDRLHDTRQHLENVLDCGV